AHGAGDRGPGGRQVRGARVTARGKSSRKAAKRPARRPKVLPRQRLVDGATFRRLAAATLAQCGDFPRPWHVSSHDNHQRVCLVAANGRMVSEILPAQQNGKALPRAQVYELVTAICHAVNGAEP
ncbi:MAG TPA: hypothetical protein VMU93_16770, partial [Caulobacteraceae bacterium]|nr:hypothetical protein [Caulobacteraceae bacterium]